MQLWRRSRRLPRLFKPPCMHQDRCSTRRRCLDKSGGQIQSLGHSYLRLPAMLCAHLHQPGVTGRMLSLFDTPGMTEMSVALFARWIVNVLKIWTTSAMCVVEISGDIDAEASDSAMNYEPQHLWCNIWINCRQQRMWLVSTVRSFLALIDYCWQASQSMGGYLPVEIFW